MTEPKRKFLEHIIKMLHAAHIQVIEIDTGSVLGNSLPNQGAQLRIGFNVRYWTSHPLFTACPTIARSNVVRTDAQLAIAMLDVRLML